MTFRPMPTAKALWGSFDYSPESGFLYWKWRDFMPLHINRRCAGKVADTYSLSGWQVRWAGLLMSHRVIFVMTYGDCLDVNDEVDHIDLNKHNNLIGNLRKATHSQNGANKEKQINNTSGAKAVDQLPSGSWRTRLAGQHVGCYSSLEEALVNYDLAATKLYGDYRRVSLLQK